MLRAFVVWLGTVQMKDIKKPFASARCCQGLSNCHPDTHVNLKQIGVGVAGHPTFFLDLAFPMHTRRQRFKRYGHFHNEGCVFSREYTCPGKLRFTVQMLQEWPFWQIGFKPI